MRAAVVGTLLAVALAAAEARADGLALAVEGGYFDMANARESARAVFGSAGGATFGAELRYDLGERLFVALGARSFRKTGERAFVADGEVFRLGHPLRVRIVPVGVTLGYRLGRIWGFAPYAGIGGGVASYSERSEVAGEVEENSKTKPSGHLLAGLEWGHGRFGLGVEAAYSRVPDTIGDGGVSKVYGESDVGGFTVVGKVVIRLAER